MNVQAFADPTAYKLKVKRPGSDESREVNVDLLETFNWLVGLTVQSIAAPQVFAAEFARDPEGRLELKGRLRQDATAPWWFRTVTGTTPDGRRTLIIWRKLTGDAEQDNLMLDEWFKRAGYSEFSGSLFHGINTPTSPVNLLIGSKKFTEGWNSWRVSTMGLMNVGQTEGSQIIQLFGRGVRLKGYNSSLKRSSKVQLPDEVQRPSHIGVLETLSIFGIRADYMAQFRDFLEEEGLPRQCWNILR